MKLPAHGPTTAHLTYCLNIHPGETWAENLAAIRQHTLRVAQNLRPQHAAQGHTPIGVGLRLSADAAAALHGDREVRQYFPVFLRENGLYVFTINGFPFGRFHGGQVKERVYLPDWRSAARREYTLQLIDILAGILPAGMDGSISTVPGGFRPLMQSENDIRLMVGHLMDCVLHCARVEAETGREIHLGLEPEPACYLETTAEVIHFFEAYLLPFGGAMLAAKTGTGREMAESLIRRHLGVCLDTCHAALQFEDPDKNIDRYQNAGIRLSKIQISAALSTPNHAAGRGALQSFIEPVYLHQVRVNQGGDSAGWVDLPEALPALLEYPELAEVRVHFHVPLFWDGTPPLQTTAATMTPAFWQKIRAGVCPHLEIETYTFDVLPPAMRSGPVETHILREYAWVLAHLT
jgi:hypothetical protein